MKKVVIKNERGEQSEFSEFDFEFVFLTAGPGCSKDRLN